MKNIVTISQGFNHQKNHNCGGCGECQTSCQSACKTSCGICNQKCENPNLTEKE